MFARARVCDSIACAGLSDALSLVYMPGTCEWQFSPPFNPALAGGAGGGGAKGAQSGQAGGAGAIVYVCCADAQELQVCV
jgi:hypothetical protein